MAGEKLTRITRGRIRIKPGRQSLVPNEGVTAKFHSMHSCELVQPIRRPEVVLLRRRSNYLPLKFVFRNKNPALLGERNRIAGIGGENPFLRGGPIKQPASSSTVL